nr:hypothetical protein [Tanacetum cinerariifolium]
MFNLLEDIQCAGSDTRPPMLDRTDFASWQQRIRLYYLGTEGALHLGPERPRVYSNLTPEEKDRYNADIRATNILIQGLPKDIYSLINHYTDSKDICDNVKMLLEGSELTKEDRESQLYDDFEHFRQHKGETIHDYNVRFAKLINDIRNIKMTMSRMQLNSKFVNNMLPEWGRFVTMGQQNRGHGNNARGVGAVGYRGAQNRVGYANPGQARQIKCYNCNALNVDNVFQADDCDAFDSDVDEAPTVQIMVMANLSSADPVYDEASPSYDSYILSKVHDHDHYQDAACEHHEEHEMQDDVQPAYVVESHVDYARDSDMIPYDQYELHSVKMQLASTINHNKSMVVEVTSLKKDFKQKENKYVKEFLDMKTLKEKVEDKLYKKDQSLQTVHKLCKPKPYYDEQNKVAIGYKNPLCLTRTKQFQPALYNGHEIIKINHVPAIVHNTEETLEIAEITRKKINEKMNDPECVKKKVKIAPHDYSKENYLATFTPQKQLTPKQIFWSKDLTKRNQKLLKSRP